MTQAVFFFSNESKLEGLIGSADVEQLGLSDLDSKKCKGYDYESGTFQEISASHNIVAVSDFVTAVDAEQNTELKKLIEKADEVLILKHSQTRDEGINWILETHKGATRLLIPGAHEPWPGFFYSEFLDVLIDAIPTKGTPRPTGSSPKFQARILECLIQVLTGDPLLEGKLYLLHDLYDQKLEESTLESEFKKRVPQGDLNLYQRMLEEFKDAFKELLVQKRDSDEYRKHLSVLRDLWLGKDQ